MKLLFKRMLAYFPTELPTGMTALNQWIEDVVELTGPIADKDSITYVACHETLALKNTVNSIAKMNIVKRIRKYAYNQCASQVLMEINKRHEAAKLAAKQQQEATTSASTTNGSEAEAQPTVTVQ